MTAPEPQTLTFRMLQVSAASLPFPYGDGQPSFVQDGMVIRMEMVFTPASSDAQDSYPATTTFVGVTGSGYTLGKVVVLDPGQSNDNYNFRWRQGDATLTQNNQAWVEGFSLTEFKQMPPDYLNYIEVDNANIGDRLLFQMQLRTQDVDGGPGPDPDPDPDPVDPPQSYFHLDGERSGDPSPFTRTLWSTSFVVDAASVEGEGATLSTTPAVTGVGLHAEIGPVRAAEALTALVVRDGSNEPLCRVVAPLEANRLLDAVYLEPVGHLRGDFDTDGVTGFIDRNYAKEQLEGWGPNIYAALMAGDPLSVSDPEMLEVIGPVYARCDMQAAVTMDGAEPPILRNTTELIWGGLPKGTLVTHLALFDDPTGGNLLWSHKLDSPLQFPKGGSLRYPVGGYAVYPRVPSGLLGSFQPGFYVVSTSPDKQTVVTSSYFDYTRFRIISAPKAGAVGPQRFVIGIQAIDNPTDPGYKRINTSIRIGRLGFGSNGPQIFARYDGSDPKPPFTEQIVDVTFDKEADQDRIIFVYPYASALSQTDIQATYLLEGSPNQP